MNLSIRKSLFARFFIVGFGFFLSWSGITIASAEEVNPRRLIIMAGEALLQPGSAPRRNIQIIVEGGKFSRIEEMSTSSPEANDRTRVIDLSCCFIMPGLIDVQTHLVSEPGLAPRHVRLTEWTDADFTIRAIINARRTVEAGFTTIRDMGHSGQSVFAVRSAIDRGLIPGPRMQVAGEIIRPTGGELRAWFRPDIEPLFHHATVCDGPNDCKRAVRAAVAGGATTIKVETKQDLTDQSPSQFDRDELLAIRSAAHDLGVKVTASAFSTPSMNLPLRAGFDGIVHTTYADKETMRLLQKTEAFFIPTLLAARVVREIAEDLSVPVSDSWRVENLSIYHGMVASFQLAMKSGVNIAFGTDAGWRPHGGNGEQLVQMVELGMKPAEALKSATINAARAIGWADRVGSIESDKFADLVVLDGSPIEKISRVLEPVMVIKGGEVVFNKATK